MIELLRPWALLLLPLPALALLWLPLDGRHAALVLPQRIYKLMDAVTGDTTDTASRRRWRLLLALLGWIALVLALAVPLTKGPPLQKASGRDLLLAIDLSTSMQARDVTLNNRQTDRYTAVKSIAGEFIKGRKGDRVGLIVFAKETYLLAPLSYDVEAVAGYLDEVIVGLPGQKTAVGDAIGLAIKTLRAQPEASRVLILLSDGESNAGDIGPAQAARLARDNNISVHTIGFGQAVKTASTTTADNTSETSTEPAAGGLQAVAQMSGGRHFEASTSQGLRDVYAELDQLEPTALEEEPQLAERDWVQELLFIALIALVLLSVIDLRQRRI